MTLKIPPGEIQHESLLDVNQTQVSFHTDQTTTKQNYSGSKKPFASKPVFCLVVVFLVVCLIVAAWYNDVVVLSAIAGAFAYAFEKLIDAMLLERQA